MRYRPPHQKLGADSNDSCSYRTEGVGRFVFFSLLLFSFFFSAISVMKHPGHTQVGTGVIVVKTLNVFVGDSTVYYFYDSHKKKGTKGIGPGLACGTKTQTIDPSLMFKSSSLSLSFPGAFISAEFMRKNKTKNIIQRCFGGLRISVLNF